MNRYLMKINKLMQIVYNINNNINNGKLIKKYSLILKN